MSASKTIGGINVTISATTEKFEKAIARTRKTLSGFTQSLMTVKGLTGALAGYATARGMLALASNTYHAIDAFGELSDKLGIGTKRLKGLQLAAEEAGVSASTFERAMVRLNKDGMGGEGGLRQWIEQTAALSTHQERLAATTKMFGSRGSDMVRMLEGGTAALDDAQKAAERFGWSMDRQGVKAVERAMDAFGRLKLAVSGFVGALAVASAPIAEFTAKALAELTRGVLGLVNSFKSLAYWAKFGWDEVIKGGVWLSGMNIRERMGTISAMPAKAAAGPGANAMRGYGSTGRIVGGRGAFSNGRGFGSDSAGRFAMFGADGKVDTAATINAKWQRAIDYMMMEPIGGSRRGLLSRIAGDTMGGLGSRIGQRLGGTMGFFNNPASQLFLSLQRKMLEWQSGVDFSKVRAGGSRGSLAFAQSGSAESYRQQAAIRRQNETLNLDKKRNGILEDIRDAVRNPPNMLAAANFGGR